MSALLLLSFVLAADPAASSCVASNSEARPSGYGFNHIVSLDNGCETAVTCKVSTDVSPEPQSVALGRGEKKDVTTFLAAPARAFQASVKCSPAK